MVSCNKKSIVIISITVVVLILILILIWVSSNNKDDRDKNNGGNVPIVTTAKATTIEENTREGSAFEEDEALDENSNVNNTSVIGEKIIDCC